MIRKLNNEIVKHVEDEYVSDAHREILSFIDRLNVSKITKKIYYTYNSGYKKIINIYLVLRGKKYETKKD